MLGAGQSCGSTGTGFVKTSDIPSDDDEDEEEVHSVTGSALYLQLVSLYALMQGRGSHAFSVIPNSEVPG